MLPDPELTMRAGGELAAALHAAGEGGCARSLHLSGSLGAGKTTLVRGLLRGLGHCGPVRSPTYTLVEPYAFAGLDVYHFDLYRLAAPLELEDFGVRDYFHPRALCVVEWPERGAGVLPGADLSLELCISGTGRLLHARGETREGRALLAAWSVPAW